MNDDDDRPVLIIVMGTSGCGKSTFGTLLAQALSIPFLDGDDLHPQANVDKMSRGEALDDDDRWPWLQAIRQKAIQVTHPVHRHSASERERSSKDDPLPEEERIREMVEIHETTQHHPESFTRPTREAEAKRDIQSGRNSTESACIIACSALKQRYRDFLRGDASSDLFVIHIYLHVEPEELHRRMRARKGHFMKESMLQSQLATLEDPAGESNTIVIEDAKPDEQVQKAKERLKSMLR